MNNTMRPGEYRYFSVPRKELVMLPPPAGKRLPPMPKDTPVPGELRALVDMYYAPPPESTHLGDTIPPSTKRSAGE